MFDRKLFRKNSRDVSLSLRKFPLANSSPLAVPLPTLNLSQGTPPLRTGSTSVTPSNPPGHGATSGSGNANPLSPSSMHTTTSQAPAPIRQARFIFLLSKFGRYDVDELLSLHLDTAKFGDELRLAYLRRKGFWSSWLSPSGFSHCDFVKVSFHRLL